MLLPVALRVSREQARGIEIDGESLDSALFLGCKPVPGGSERRRDSDSGPTSSRAHQSNHPADSNTRRPIPCRSKPGNFPGFRRSPLGAARRPGCIDRFGPRRGPGRFVPADCPVRHGRPRREPEPPVHTDGPHRVGYPVPAAACGRETVGKSGRSKMTGRHIPIPLGERTRTW